MIINVLSVGFIILIMQFLHGHALDLFITYSTIALVSTGILFFLGTSVGLIRFPDFYSRMHAAGKGDTLSSILILYGCAIYSLKGGHLSLGSVLVAIKILIIINFIFIGSPTATHAMMNAGHKMGVKHWKSGKKT